MTKIESGSVRVGAQNNKDNGKVPVRNVGDERLVDKNGANSNQDAFKELTRWGVIIEKTRGFPSHYEIGSK